MFDIFTRRRIIVFLCTVLFVILSIAVFARIIPSYSNYSAKSIEIPEASECYLTEPNDILTLCQKCTSYERRSQAYACALTGYKELVLCSKSNIKTSRSCPIPINIQRQHFWLFEGFMLFLAVFAILNVNSRQKALDKQMIERIKRQIGENDE